MTHPETVMMIAVDRDDQPTISALATAELDRNRVVVSIAERPDALGAKFNRVMVECPADVYSPMVDYVSHITPGFDDIILDAARTYSDDICAVYGPLANLCFPCFQAVTHKLAQMIGYIHPPFFPFWFGDHWLDDIVRDIDRIAYADLVMERSGKWSHTANLRDVPFWAAFHDRSMPQRHKIARRIIESAEFHETARHKEALIRNFPLVEQRSRIINAEAVRLTAANAEVPDSPQHQRLRVAANKLLAESGAEPIDWPPPPAPPDPRSVMFLTPNLSYWVSCEFYASSMQAFAQLQYRGIPQYWTLKGGHPFPDYVRDTMATDGLQERYPYQNFFWIDDDVGYPPDNILQFLDRPEPVVLGVYPQKTDPRQPGHYFVDFIIGDDGKPVERDGLLAVNSKAPAGFMRVKRWVLERVAQSYGLYVDVFPASSREYKLLFDIFRAGLDGERRYRGEDTAFVRRCRELGIEVWCDPNIRFSHRGSYAWAGSLADNLKHVTMPVRAKQPSLGPVLDYSRAVYADPPSHDFLTWLVVAEMMRRHHEAPGPLRVRFLTVDGMLGRLQWSEHSLRSGLVYGAGCSREYYQTMLDGVLRPAIEMIGVVEEPMLDISTADLSTMRFPPELQNWVEYDHHVCLPVDAARAGHTIPLFSPVEWALAEVDAFLAGREAVVITLREHSVEPERNSNIEAWARFAEWLGKRGYWPVVVRDTAVAYEPFGDAQTYPRASQNAYIRAALYHRALLNMTFATGPGEWLIFGSAPYLYFNLRGEVQPTDRMAQDHLQAGEQYPWALPHQRLTWCDDTFENLQDEFERFIAIKELRAAE